MLKLIKQKQEGFTLIELMIVVAIIGILAAIAIPQFSAYRVKAFNSTAEADNRNLQTAQEAAYTEYQSYVNHGDIGSDTGVTTSITSLPGAKLSKGVKAQSTSTTSSAYNEITKHIQGDKKYTASPSTGMTASTATAGTALF